MVLTMPAISFAQEFTNETVTVKGDEVQDNVVEAKDANVTVNGSLSHNADGDSIIADSSTVTVNKFLEFHDPLNYPCCDIR